MSVIIRSGYFKVDENGYTASIVFSDGRETQKLVTKRQALEIGEGFLGIEITTEEWSAIRQQIHASPLLEKSTCLERMADEMQGRLDQLKRLVEQFLRKQNDGDGWKSEK